ncbi:hypothetical protein [Bradyrhizobium roseum]|uniref:hypothetical protein n=1 Tax=Bradyrhizobium roseum TaxID=3056648 RepID=UPI0026375C33|nr:hypothetical protein [Bradyrhizobium roseus]WKA28449.1 hypothetical protein QUH67_33810 [Bradyrhizobium roseus]
MADIASDLNHLQSLLSQISIMASLPQTKGDDLGAKIADCFAPLVRIHEAVRKSPHSGRRF